MPFKRVITSNLMAFKCCFPIPQYHENCSAMSSFTVLRHVPRNTVFAVLFNVFISLLWFLFIVYYLVLWFLFIVYHLFLVMQQITNTVILLKFQQNVQFWSVIFKKAFQDHKHYLIFKNRNMQLRFEIAMTYIKGQLMANDKFPELS